MSLLQLPTQGHYATYDAMLPKSNLRPIMQHMSKNVVTVNEGRFVDIQAVIVKLLF